MKVLMVSPYPPSPTSGSRSRSYYLLKMLARRHAVSLLAKDESDEVEAPQGMASLESLTSKLELLPVSPTYPKRLRQIGDVISGQSNIINNQRAAGMQNALDLFFEHDPYDAVVFEGAVTGGYRLPEHVMVIANQHNIEYEVLWRTFLSETHWLRKWYNWRESRLVRQVELKLCREADAIAVTSERERLLLKSILPQSVVEVVPNGVDIEYFHWYGAEQEVDGRIVFTGSMEYYPNVEAVLCFARKCWPLIQAHLPGATWHIVGKNPLPAVQKLAELAGVTVTGSVTDVRPFIAEAKVAIVPLLVGGGTRLKILEALAMRKAVVSTSLGCEGLSVVPGKHLIVADQPEAFAQAVLQLMENPHKRQALGSAGRALVEAQYSWEYCGDQLLGVLEQLHAIRTGH